MIIGKPLRCPRHGEVAWKGDLVCSNDRCRTVYQAGPVEPDGTVPYEYFNHRERARVAMVGDGGDCGNCGKRFAPDTRRPLVKFSARAVCSACVQEVCPSVTYDGGVSQTGPAGGDTKPS
jgi:hypothetical protein